MHPYVPLSQIHDRKHMATFVFSVPPSHSPPHHMIILEQIPDIPFCLQTPWDVPLYKPLLSASLSLSPYHNHIQKLKAINNHTVKHPDTVQPSQIFSGVDLLYQLIYSHQGPRIYISYLYYGSNVFSFTGYLLFIPFAIYLRGKRLFNL